MRRPRSVGAGELANLLRLADALLDAALARTESRGAHARREYTHTDPGVAPTHRPRAGPGAEQFVSEEEPEPEAYARAVADAVGRALAEDLGPEGDLTAALVPEDVTAHFALRARHNGILAGRELRQRRRSGSSTQRSSSSGTWSTAPSCRPATPSWR